MKYTSAAVVIIVCSIFFLSAEEEVKSPLKEHVYVYDLLNEIKPQDSAFEVDLTIPGVSAKRGEQIVKFGFADKQNGGKTKIQSKHFVCISCHNVEKEDFDLANPDPEHRLRYTAERGLPFLQGTTFYGAVNRKHFYNDDYVKKYGKLVDVARNNIRESIQLCAIECAQGRRLKNWEVESILAYFWTLQLKVNDLLLAGEELEFINSVNWKDTSNINQAVHIIESKYLDRSPAHFEYPPENRKIGYGLVGNPDNGKLIYENSCLYCHKNQKYSFLHLDNSKLSFKHLNSRAGSYSPHSIYQVTRWGVPSKSGKRSYMPFYPIEKMSNQQVEDLRAYIKLRS